MSGPARLLNVTGATLIEKSALFIEKADPLRAALPMAISAGALMLRDCNRQVEKDLLEVYEPLPMWGGRQTRNIWLEQGDVFG